MNTTPDGDYQTYKANDGGYVRDHFFGRDPRKALVENMSDQDIWKRGGHDYCKGLRLTPTAPPSTTRDSRRSLAKTIKGYAGRGISEGRNATHQIN